MAGKPINMEGQRYGYLTVLKETKRQNGNLLRACKCDCGNIVYHQRGNLIHGNVSSCGCRNNEHAKKHGLSNTRLYDIYSKMKARCCNPNNQAYKNYGGRGIKICNEWLSDFAEFYTWAISNGYHDNLTIERIDVNGNYEPSNCCWIPREDQGHNTRRTILIEIDGVQKTIREWSHIYHVDRHVVSKRIKNGEDGADVIRYLLNTKRHKSMIKNYEQKGTYQYG